MPTPNLAVRQLKVCALGLAELLEALRGACEYECNEQPHRP
ncbi:hypothetical protein [Steroidobacter agaridevorans]|nr:hypothetical protein [Steroidobacter agaridevorans]